MPAARLCPQCGVELPVDAPAGLCPRCLLQHGIGNGSGSPASSANDPTLAPRATNPSGPPPGTQVRYFGDYEILEEIARGGMGVVYKARQVSLDRTVALKMILAGQLASDSAVERFYTEAKAAANLQHPNIVAIHEIGRHEGQHYFSMDYVEGRSLAQLVRDFSLPAAKAASYVKTIAEAIEFAHRQGTLHRDLKPSNILIDSSDQPRVTDFGLAKQIEASAGQLTATGSLMGTPSYMSPEQAGAHGGKVGPASDVYSLGGVLYELVTGRPPFLGETLAATLNQVLNTEPVSPRMLNSRVPRDLETICLKCLEKSADHRYRSAGELADDLGRFLAGEPVHARPAGRVRRTAAWVRKRPWSVSAGIALALLLVACGAYGLWTEIREGRRKNLLLAARIARLSSPAKIDVALDDLRRAARIRPDQQIYREALELFVGDVGPKLDIPRDPWIKKPPLGESRIALGEHAVSFSWSRDGRQLYFQGVRIDAANGRTAELSIEGAGPAVADPTGSHLAAVGADGTIVVLHRATSRRRQIERRVTTLAALRFAPDGRSLAVLSESQSSGGARQLELWKPDGDAPPIQVVGPLSGNWLVRFSGDSSRLAVWCQSRPSSVMIANTRDGSTIAELALLPEGMPPLDLALNNDGTELAWSPHGHFYQRAHGMIADVINQDVATGAVVRRLFTGGSSIVDAQAYAPDGRFLFGHEMGTTLSLAGFLSGEGWVGFERVAVWDLTTGQLVLWLPGEAFADGTGAHDELAIYRQMDVPKPFRIEFVRPAVLAARIADAGLGPCVRAPVIDRLDAQTLLSFVLGWPTLLGLAAFCVVNVSSLNRYKRGQAMPPTLALLTAVLGLIAIVWAIFRLLGVFDFPDWSWLEMGLAIVASFVPVMMGTIAVWTSVRSLASARRGENVPVIRPYAPLEDIDRAGAWGVRLLAAMWAGWIVFIVAAALDGSVPRFGLAGLLIVGGVAGFMLVVMLLVPLRLVAERRMKRWSVPAMKRLQEWFAPSRVALSLWTCIAVVAGIYAAAGLWEWIAARAWRLLPAWHWGLEFEVTIQRQTLHSVTFAVAIVVLAAALLKVLRLAKSSA
jgi:tRNA A-37 threonylcarbamoyl transferase component Bud32